MTRAAVGPKEGGSMRRALVVMARRPGAEDTKTRLCPPLDPVQAAELYQALLMDTLAAAERVECEGRFVAYTPDPPADHFAELAHGFCLVPQGEGTLGERLDRVLGRCLAEGFGTALALASDSPTLPPSHVARAFHLLQGNDLVLGPCEDGGYYLAGQSRPLAPLFSRVTMSTPRVLDDTLELAQRLGWRSSLAPPHWDVDTGEDLMRLKRELASGSEGLAPNTRRVMASWGWL